VTGLRAGSGGGLRAILCGTPVAPWFAGTGRLERWAAGRVCLRTFFHGLEQTDGPGATWHGETVLIQGGAQRHWVCCDSIGESHGGRVLQRLGSDEKVRGLGLALVPMRRSIYKTQIFRWSLRGSRMGQGVDVIWTWWAGQYGRKEVQSLARDGAW